MCRKIYQIVFSLFLKQFCLITPKPRLTSSVEAKGDMHILCVGDLNARIGDIHDLVINDDTQYVPIDENYDVDVFSARKVSKDTEVNNFGKSVLEI
jgi:hypothetical protein